MNKHVFQPYISRTVLQLVTVDIHNDQIFIARVVMTYGLTYDDFTSNYILTYLKEKVETIVLFTTF
jgi:hypothetical protein